MKKICTCLFVCFLFTNLGFSQKIKTIEKNGNKYFVYPHKISVTGLPFHAKSYKKFKKQYIATYDQWIQDANGEEKQNLISDKENRIHNYTGTTRSKGRIENWVKRCKRKDLTFISRASYSHRKDIKPSLDPIPDGKYVQFFEPIIQNADIEIDSSKIAGYFNIKNNVIEGDAIWLYENGDTSHIGTYQKGLKEGLWIFKDRKRNLSRYGKIKVRKRKKRTKTTKTINIKPFYSSSFVTYGDEHITYKNGMKDGLFQTVWLDSIITSRKYYSEDKQVGIWDRNYINFTSGELILGFKSTIADSVVISHIPLVMRSLRSTSLTFDTDSVEFLFDYSLARYVEDNFAKNKVKEPVFSYSNYGGYLSTEFIQNGYYSKFKDTITEWYPNGQIKWSIPIINGKILKDPTIYFDNGKMASEVIFNSDSNKYFHHTYNYRGDIMNIAIHDSLGKFSYNDPAYTTKDPVMNYKGLQLKDAYREMLFSYSDMKAPLRENLKDTTYLKLKIYLDSSVSEEMYFLPKLNKLIVAEYYYGDTVKYEEYQFDEQYKRFSGIETIYWENLKKVTSMNGTINEDLEFIDSLPVYQFLDFGTLGEYDITSISKIHLNNAPFSGDVIVNFKTAKNGKTKWKTDNNSIHIQVRGSKRFGKSDKYVQKYASKRGWSYPRAELQLLQNYYKKNPAAGIIKSTVNDIFGKVDYPFPNKYIEYEYYNYGKQNQEYSYVGHLENGAYEGQWKALGSKKFVARTYDFVQNEYNGKIQEYKEVDKSDYDKENGLYYDGNYVEIGKKLPPFYLASVKGLKNDLYEGPQTKFDIHGNVIEKFNYKNDLLEGSAYTQGDFYFIKENFHHGLRDGKVEIFMTHEDTVLMSDLRFQNGRLSGKSVIYHANGTVAKKGFFLDGEPIESYEAFDDKGQLYHYVHFKYGFAVEEKIWEENQLSAKYDFDWKDSIEFNNFDFVLNQNYVDEVLYSTGRMGNNYFKSYQGRPSMIDKDEESFFLTKYYPDNTMARKGRIESGGQKIGQWEYFHYEGYKLYDVNYNDSIIHINDSVSVQTYGRYIDFNKTGDSLSIRYITEIKSKYDCANTDHYEIRQFYAPETENQNDSVLNGWIKNYYDNGVLQSEGKMSNGMATGVWKIYDPYGKLNQVGEYENGVRQGRWLKGDLAKIKFLGNICLNPNMPDLEKEISKREKQLDVKVSYYDKGKLKNTDHFDLDLNKKKFDEGLEYNYHPYITNPSF